MTLKSNGVAREIDPVVLENYEPPNCVPRGAFFASIEKGITLNKLPTTSVLTLEGEDMPVIRI